MTGVCCPVDTHPLPLHSTCLGKTGKVTARFSLYMVGPLWLTVATTLIRCFVFVELKCQIL